jgi:hypothetical protein
MDNWDEEKLRTVVLSKAGNPRTTTDVTIFPLLDANTSNRCQIVCKYFIDAVESGKYGWFWECPNGQISILASIALAKSSTAHSTGETCQYRHALPPGFVLNSQKAKEATSKSITITLEEFIEVEVGEANF